MLSHGRVSEAPGQAIPSPLPAAEQTLLALRGERAAAPAPRKPRGILKQQFKYLVNTL